MDEAIRKRVMRKSTAQEKRTARRYGGTRQPGSGNGLVRKNDVRSEHFLIENKTCLGSKQITLKAVDLVGVMNNAARESRIGALQFDLGNRGFVVLDENDFRWLIGDV